MKHIFNFLSIALTTSKKNQLFVSVCLLSLTLTLFPKPVFAQSVTPGDLDQIFGTATGANQSINCMAVQNDGRVIIGGFFSAFSGNFISRLDLSGARDPLFNQAAASFNGPVNAVAIQDDGKIIVGGSFSSFAGAFKSNVARLNANGTLDTSFGGSNTTDGTVRTIVIQPDGKVLIGGDFFTVNGLLSKNRIARLNADGTLDQTFNASSLPINNSVMTISLLNNGKVFVGGNFNTFNGLAVNGVVQLNSDGSHDATFNAGGIGLSNGGAARSSVVQPDGKIIIGGGFASYNNFSLSNLVRLNPDGTRDVTFNAGNNLNNVVHSVTLQSNLKVIIGGQFTAYGSTPRFGVARVNGNGSLDTSFDPGLGARNGFIDVGPVRATALSRSLEGIPMAGKRLLMAGDFIAYDGVARARIAQVHIKSSQTISIDPLPEKTYGDDPFRVTASTSSGLPVDFFPSFSQSLITVNGDSVEIIGAGNATIGAHQLGDEEHYASGFASRLFTIHKAAITATADDKTRPVGSNNPPLTVSYSSFVGSDDATVLDEPPGISTTATPESIPGVYPITLSGGSDNNYLFITLIHGTLTVTGARPDVFVTSPADGTEDVGRTVTVTASALAGVTTYTIQLSPVPDFSSGILELSGSQSQRFTGLAYNTHYFARVKTDLSPLFGRVTSFITIPPELPFVVSPKDSAVDRNIALNVTANVISGASVYTIELNTNSDFTGTSFRKSGERTQRFTGLAYGTRYFTRVYALSPLNGRVTSFVTGPAEYFAFVVSPQDGAVDRNTTLNVTANTVQGASSYTIELNSSPDFTGISFVKSGERTQRFTGLANSTTYYSRVKTNLSENWGETHTFTTVGLAANARTSSSADWMGETEDATTLSSETAVKAFPNPFVDNTKVIIQSDQQLPLHLVITDAIGKELMRMNATTNELITFGDDFIPGIYLVRLSGAGQFKIMRVVKN